MRKTHPVNALKKLGIGLAFGAATIMSMPTSALACTQIYMGKNLTADGNTYYGRAEDFGARYLKHYGIEPAHEAGFKYSSIESALNTLRISLPIATAMYATTPPTGMVVPMPTPRPESTRRACHALPR